jgi:hypothetical protein
MESIESLKMFERFETTDPLLLTEPPGRGGLILRTFQDFEIPVLRLS